MKVNRRTTIRILTGAATGTGFAAAQTPTQPRPADASAELQSARDDIRGTAARIARVELPRPTEPAFRFRAY
jgi:hypothetical protein